MGASNNNSRKPKIVVIGGGSGSSTILSGLKRHSVGLTAIVTMFDSGGSSGLLRREFGYPPFGDLRQCLLALADDVQNTQPLRQALNFRFGENSSLNGHSVGNLLLAALTSVNNDLESAIAQIASILRVQGEVVPVSWEQAELCAELDDGTLVRGESEIDMRHNSSPRIASVFLEPEVSASSKAVEAIRQADAIVLGPGDLYTSILPNLLANGVVDSIASSNAACIYICNLMTKLGETDGFKASDFVREVVHYLGPAKLDWVIINTQVPSLSVQKAYEAEHAYAVQADLDEVGLQVSGVFAAPLVGSDLPLRHDPDLTALAILKIMEAGRLTKKAGSFVPPGPLRNFDTGLALSPANGVAHQSTRHSGTP